MPACSQAYLWLKASKGETDTPGRSRGTSSWMACMLLESARPSKLNRLLVRGPALPPPAPDGTWLHKGKLLHFGRFLGRMFLGRMFLWRCSSPATCITESRLQRGTLLRSVMP